MDFGNNISPFFNIKDNEITFDVLEDETLEGTERGQISIRPDPNTFAGHEPLLGSVNIVIIDDESIFCNIDF